METEAFFKDATEAFGPSGAAKIKSALDFATEKHDGQKRDSGEDYITHPFAVAKILLRMNADEATVIAGLLHDCLEDTETTEKEIRDGFGEEVLSLLVGLIKLNNIKRSYRLSGEDVEKLRKMFLAMGGDARIVFVKLADRLHNMQTLQFKAPEKRRRIAHETMDIYVPLAERLGMSVFKREMEDLCFFYLYPTEYKEVNDFLNDQYKKSERIIEDIKKSISKLADENGIEARIQSRRKSAYSVFQKWQKKGKDIYDIIANRIIVKSVQDCYTMLGAVNSKWKIVAGRNKDYIAHPKPNLYMSLHTTVLYPLEDGQSVPFEIQIRTEQMHQFCEYGVAAHWIYKENGVKRFSDGREALRKELVKEGALNPQEEGQEQYIENIKQGFYADKIFVFTPNLNVIELPKGSTPIDFAYEIHTNLGNKCVGAKVNSKMVQLTTELKTGDVVEIITNQNAKPSRDWLSKVKSSDTLSKIRAYFKKNQRDENIRLGKTMLEDFAKRNGFALSKLLEDKPSIAALQQRYNLVDLDDIYIAVGLGRLNTSQVLYKTIVNLRQEERKKKTFQERRTHRASEGVVIGGHRDLLKKFAKCCGPVPGDEVVGYVSRGKGVTIHRKDCPHLGEIEAQRIIDVEWDDSSKAERYDTTLRILASGESNIITSLTSKISESGVELTSLSVEKTKGGDNHYKVNLRIQSKRQLLDLINKLRALPHVYNVYR